MKISIFDLQAVLVLVDAAEDQRVLALTVLDLDSSAAVVVRSKELVEPVGLAVKVIGAHCIGGRHWRHLHYHVFVIVVHDL